MPHYDYNPTQGGQQAGSGSGLPPTLTTALKTGIAVQSANMLASRASDGKCYPAVEPGKPGSSLLPIYQAADITNGLQSAPTLFATSTQGRIAGALLSTGNYVLGSVSAQAPYNVTLAIYDPHGVMLSPNLVVAGQAQAAGSGAALLAIAGTGNGFCVAWNGGGAPAFAIYDKDANLIKAPTTIGAASALFALQVGVLTNGNIAFCYNLLSGGTEVPMYAVYSGAGAQIKAPSVLRAAPASNAVQVASGVAALAGGGFICVYSINMGGGTPTINTYFQRFDNAGVLQGGETLIRAGVALGSGVVVRPFATGGFFVIETADVRASVWSAAGALVGAPISKLPGLIRNRLAASAGATGGAGVFAWSDNPVTTVSVIPIYDTGPAAGAIPVTTTASADSELQVLSAAPNGGNIVVAFADASGKMAVATYDGGYNLKAKTILGTLASDLNGAASMAYGFSAFLVSPVNPAAITFLLATPTISGAASFGIVNWFVPARVPVGAFTASAAAGVYAPVQYSGVLVLTTAFDSIVTGDYRANSPVGMQFSIIGNSLVMRGVQ